MKYALAKSLYIEVVLVPIGAAIVKVQITICDTEGIHVVWLSGFPNCYLVTPAFGHIGMQRCAHKL